MHQNNLFSQTVRRTKQTCSTRRRSRRWDVESLEARQLLTATVEMIDVNTHGWGSWPSSFVELNDTLQFRANGQFYTTDGTEAGTVPLDPNSPLSGIHSDLVEVNGTKFFNGFTNRSDLEPGLYAGDNELWKTDGTAEGTLLVKDIYPGIGSTPYGDVPNSSSPNDLVNLGDTLFFTANDGVNGRELWKSDGTAEGTVLVKDIRDGVSSYGYPNSSYPSGLTSVGGTLFFVADDGTNGRELWKSDGTAEGTVLVKDIRSASYSGPYNSFPYGSDPANLTSFNDLLLFTANDGSGGIELWKSDGTTEGTVPVKEIGPDTAGSYPDWLTEYNGMLYFSANDAVHGVELWRTDGTEDGTVLVHDINPSAGSASPSSLFIFNGQLVFSADDGTNGAELWSSDGASEGAALVRDINPGAGGSSPNSFLAAGDRLYFQADDGPAHGIELWQSDGTRDGTQIAGDFWSGTLSSAPVPLYKSGNTIYVSADVDPHGRELWKTDGTETGVTLVKDIALGNWGSAFASPFQRDQPVEFNGELFFTADTCPGCIDYELWKTDGTQAGTQMVKNINSTERARRTDSNIGSRPGSFYIVNDTLFFRANDAVQGDELWMTDGTEIGTVLVKDIAPGSNGAYVSGLSNIDGTLIFRADDSVTGAELWRSDGTEAGTMLIKDINPGWTTNAYGQFANSSDPSGTTIVNGTLLFTATDPSNGTELWRTDGTEEGTVLVKDIYPGTSTDPYGVVSPNSSNSGNLINIDGTLYFSANDGTHGVELWKSDGTEAGTVMVADINTGPSDSSLGWFTNFGDHLFFAADDGVSGIELWKSDGTSEGTKLVADIHPSGGSLPSHLTSVDGKLLFVANDGSHGVELWRSDGTAVTTYIVSDINPEIADSILPSGRPSRESPIVAVNDKLYFRADDGVHGTELWQSDGTAAGTTLLADVVPGPDSSDPGSIASAGNNLYFTAPADGFRELFKIDLSSLDLPRGDFTGDGRLSADDIDALSVAMREETQDARFDLNGDNQVDQEDRRILVEEVMKTWVGDANVDGQFNTHDLVEVFQRGEYEDGVAGNSSWSDGDWNGDGEFDSSDLVAALQGGGYRQGRRVT